jgi:hypothetical protein
MIANWWRAKSYHKRQNWMMLSIGLCFLASGFIEACQWWALIAVVPAFWIVKLEFCE